MKVPNAHAVIHEGKIVVLTGEKVLRTFERNQEDKARSYIRGWNAVSSLTQSKR